MNVSDKEVIRSVWQWLRFADEDIELARHALTLSASVPYRLIAYHAQQCAEKCLKAYCVFHNIDFPYTHNISRLLELCGEDASWRETLLDAEELTYYAITTRYPGVADEVTEEDASRALKIAEIVRNTIRTALVAEGLKEEKPEKH